MKHSICWLPAEILREIILQAMGSFGAEAIETSTSRQNEDKQSLNILTHCNTGSLATAGYGTALGVIRSLQARNKLNHVYCTETRPYNQGAKAIVHTVTSVL